MTPRHLDMFAADVLQIALHARAASRSNTALQSDRQVAKSQTVQRHEVRLLLHR
jgi:hypothetical protein